MAGRAPGADRHLAPRPVGNLASLAVLDSGYPIDTVTIADRDDITADDLQAAAAAFLQHTGWSTTTGPQLTAELAYSMAENRDSGTLAKGIAEKRGWSPIARIEDRQREAGLRCAAMWFNVCCLVMRLTGLVGAHRNSLS